jgi:hypothetical protein
MELRCSRGHVFFARLEDIHSGDHHEPIPPDFAAAQQIISRADICHAFDVPPWIVGVASRPRFARLRWRLRRVWPLRADAERPQDAPTSEERRRS